MKKSYSFELADIQAIADSIGCSQRCGSSGFKVACPVHRGSDKNLYIGLGDDSNIILKCHSHDCSYGSIKKYLIDNGIIKETIEIKTTRRKRKILPVIPRIGDSLYPISTLNVHPDTIPVPKSLRLLTTHYAADSYNDVDFYVIRTAHAKAMPWFYCQMPDESKKWVCKWFLKSNRPLMNLKDILCNPDKKIIIGEGESTCNSLRKLFPHMIPTTSSGGSSCAHMTNWNVLKDRSVVIWADADVAGVKYKETIIDLLKKSNVAEVLDYPAVELFSNFSLVDKKIVRAKRPIPGGYDAADACAEMWTADKLRELEEVYLTCRNQQR